MMQTDLFGVASANTSEADGLPLVTQPGNSPLVFIPGHLYKPSPLQQDTIGKVVGPGALIQSEGQFVADLIRCLDADFAQLPEVKAQIPTSLRSKDKATEYVLLRNLDRAKGAARFRMGDSNWFYPDFIFWIVDRQTRPATQRICYLDPKGLSMGARGGWNHSKILSFVYKLVELQQAYPEAQTESGEAVSLRFKGAYISTTTYLDLKRDTAASQEFHIYDDEGQKVFPSSAEFARAGVFFGRDGISSMLEFLTSDDSLLGRVMTYVARARGLSEGEAPTDEIGCFYRYLMLKESGGREEAALGELVRYTLSGRDIEHVIERMQTHSRQKLVAYLSKNKGLAGRLLGTIQDPMAINDPCRTLLEAASR